MSTDLETLRYRNDQLMDLDGTYLSDVVTVFGVRLVLRAYAVVQTTNEDGITDTHAEDPEYEEDVAALLSFDPDAVPDLVLIPKYPERRYLIALTPMGVG